MNRKIVGLLAAVVFTTSIFAYGCSRSAQPQYQYQETIDLVHFVQDAARLVHQKGEAAFPEFNQPNSKWFNGDKYIYVWDLKGTFVVYPPFPEFLGQSIINIKDPVMGKPIGKMLTNTALDNKQGGWVQYMWAKPENTYASWKTSYVMTTTTPNGKEYIIGSGVYDMKIEKAFIVQLVDDAVDLINKEGKDAFPEFRSSKSPFIYRDTYIFVDGMDGMEYVNTAFPQLEGKNIIGLKDSNGKLLVKEYLDLADSMGSGWVEYMWPKPGQTKPSIKNTYVKKVHIGKDWYVVGCGVYLDQNEK